MKEKQAILKEFGKRLKARREAQNLTQTDLAHEINSTAAYISRLEHGGAEPGLFILLSLEVALNCPAGYLMQEL